MADMHYDKTARVWRAEGVDFGEARCEIDPVAGVHDVEIRLRGHAVLHSFEPSAAPVYDGVTYEPMFKRLQEANVMDFYANGDAAPIGRFNYLFKE